MWWRPVSRNISRHEHRTHGVNILCNTRVVRLEGAGRVERVVCADGSSHDGGLGDRRASAPSRPPNLRARPGSNATTASWWTNTAAPAMRRSMPRAIAPIIRRCASAGECAWNRWTTRSSRRRPPPSICSTGRSRTIGCLGSGPINSTTSCSSSGLSQDYDQQVLRGDPATRSFSVCYLKGRELLAVEAVNHSKDYMAARKLIAERAPWTREAGGRRAGAQRGV